jgi:hypothetical protein
MKAPSRVLADEILRHDELCVGTVNHRQIVAAANASDGVDLLIEVGAGSSFLRIGHWPSFIPGEHLQLDEGREVSERIATDLARSPVGRPLASPVGVAPPGPCCPTRELDSG